MGEQVGILWNELFDKYNIKIHFAHRTFSWFSEAKGKAAVHVVIIGFAAFDTDKKTIFEYEDIKGEPHGIKSNFINRYLVDSEDITINSRNKPLCNAPEMTKGSMPIDNGNFVFTENEKKEFSRIEAGAIKYFRPFIGAKEFINSIPRWCLWLKDIEPNELNQLPNVKLRIGAVKEYRSKSKRKATNKAAQLPALFVEIRQPEKDFIAIPEVSSERRKYIPIGFLSKDVVPSDLRALGLITIWI